MSNAVRSRVFSVGLRFSVYRSRGHVTWHGVGASALGAASACVHIECLGASRVAVSS